MARAVAFFRSQAGGPGWSRREGVRARRESQAGGCKRYEEAGGCNRQAGGSRRQFPGGIPPALFKLSSQAGGGFGGSGPPVLTMCLHRAMNKGSLRRSRACVRSNGRRWVKDRTCSSASSAVVPVVSLGGPSSVLKNDSAHSWTQVGLV